MSVARVAVPDFVSTVITRFEAMPNFGGIIDLDQSDTIDFDGNLARRKSQAHDLFRGLHVQPSRWPQSTSMSIFRTSLPPLSRTICSAARRASG